MVGFGRCQVNQSMHKVTLKMVLEQNMLNLKQEPS
jgi:hypothetical protein